MRRGPPTLRQPPAGRERARGGDLGFEAATAGADVRVAGVSRPFYRPVIEWVARSWKLRALQEDQEVALALLWLAW